MIDVQVLMDNGLLVDSLPYKLDIFLEQNIVAGKAEVLNSCLIENGHIHFREKALIYIQLTPPGHSDESYMCPRG